MVQLVFIESFADIISWVSPFVLGALMGYISVSCDNLIKAYKILNGKIQEMRSVLRNNLAEKPSKKEIEKRQRLVPIYLTLISIFTAFTKISDSYLENLTYNSTYLSEAQQVLESIEKIIQFNLLIMGYALFVIFIIGYYIDLDTINIKRSKFFGIMASFCFGLIFTIDLKLLTNYTHLDVSNLILLFVLFICLSAVVALSLVWTFKEENLNVNVEDE